MSFAKGPRAMWWPSQLAVALVTVATVGTAVVGCGDKPAASKSNTSGTSTATISATTGGAPQTSSTVPAVPTDYTRLLIQAADIHAPEVFVASPPISNPNGRMGATTTFSNDDRTHVIYDTIEILADPATATSALNNRKGALDGIVHGFPAPYAVGTGGTIVEGPSPDGAKGVTVLLFTEGRAFVELQFDGPAHAPAPDDFLTDVGRQQDEAIRKGLPG